MYQIEPTISKRHGVEQTKLLLVNEMVKPVLITKVVFQRAMHESKMTYRFLAPTVCWPLRSYL